METGVSITGSGAASIANIRIGVAGWSSTMMLIEDRLDGFGAACTSFSPSVAAPIFVLEHDKWFSSLGRCVERARNPRDCEVVASAPLQLQTRQSYAVILERSS